MEVEVVESGFIVETSPSGDVLYFLKEEMGPETEIKVQDEMIMEEVMEEVEMSPTEDDFYYIEEETEVEEVISETNTVTEEVETSYTKNDVYSIEEETVPETEIELIEEAALQEMEVVADETDVYFEEFLLEQPKPEEPSFGDTEENRDTDLDKVMENENERIFCSNCSFSTTCKPLMEQHYKQFHGIKLPDKNKCPHCHYSNDQPAILIKHVQRHLPPDQRSFQCFIQECTFSCTNEKQLELHLTVTHGTDAFVRKCPQCDFSTVLAPNLKKHIAEVHCFKCTFEYCDFKCKSEQALKNHSAKRHGVREVKKCPHCDYETVHSGLMNVHSQIHLPANQRRHQCKYEGCGFGATRKLNLMYHYTKAHKEALQCPHCDFSTTTQSKFVQHKRKHLPSEKVVNGGGELLKSTTPTKNGDGLKGQSLTTSVTTLKSPLSCRLCKFSTSAARELFSHIQEHYRTTQREPFRCDEDGCTSRFWQKEKLNIHVAEKHGDELHYETENIEHGEELNFEAECIESDSDVDEGGFKIELFAKNGVFKCVVEGCSFICGNKERVEGHVKIHCASAGVVLKCQLCTYVSTSLGDFHLHSQAHLLDLK